MSPKYKLTYFNFRALAEPIRLLFAAAKVPFEDVRLAVKDWPELKSKFMWEVLPVLEEDGRTLSESVAIVRYLGVKFNFAGKDEWERAKCDEYCDAILDLRLVFMEAMWAKDEIQRSNMRKKWISELLPNCLRKLCDILTKNGSGWLVGQSLTYADIYVVGILDYVINRFEGSEAEVANSFTKYREFEKKVFSQDGIHEWIAKRHFSEY